jgi:hypothetical protein
LDIHSFNYHTWLSRHPYVGHARLFPQINKLVKKVNASELLDSLILDVEH